MENWSKTLILTIRGEREGGTEGGRREREIEKGSWETGRKGGRERAQRQEVGGEGREEGSEGKGGREEGGKTPFLGQRVAKQIRGREACTPQTGAVVSEGGVLHVGFND